MVVVMLMMLRHIVFVPSRRGKSRRGRRRGGFHGWHKILLLLLLLLMSRGVGWAVATATVISHGRVVRNPIGAENDRLFRRRSPGVRIVVGVA